MKGYQKPLLARSQYFTPLPLIIACVSLISGPARSACTGPAGEEGAMFYNNSANAPQYCDGSDWIALGAISDACADSPSPGAVCLDDTIYAGLSPDGNVPMYVPPSDQSSGAYWGTHGYTTGSTSYTDGPANQADVYAHVMNGDGTYNPDDGYTPNAFVLCHDLTYGGRSDWYLPARDELDVLYNNAAAIGGFDTSGTYYWSSSEHSYSHAWRRRFSDGGQGTNDKKYTYAVRCARHD
jgi:hypothetical protein